MHETRCRREIDDRARGARECEHGGDFGAHGVEDAAEVDVHYVTPGFVCFAEEERFGLAGGEVDGAGAVDAAVEGVEGADRGGYPGGESGGVCGVDLSEE